MQQGQVGGVAVVTLAAAAAQVVVVVVHVGRVRPQKLTQVAVFRKLGQKTQWFVLCTCRYNLMKGFKTYLGFAKMSILNIIAIEGVEFRPSNKFDDLMMK